MSALSQQVNMNNFLSLLLSTSLVAANSSPTNDAPSYSAPADFTHGVSSFALPAEERSSADSYTLAFINSSYENSEGVMVNKSEEKAKYGEGKILNVTGILVHITDASNKFDNTGCEKKWKGTNGEDLPTHAWIALVKRGRCNFEDKVKHAYWNNASGVIIYNDKEAINLDKMKINDKERNITAVFTFKSKGEELAKIVDSGIELMVSISEGTKHVRSLANLNRTSVLFVSISFIVLMIISLVWLVFYYVQRFRYLQTKDKQSRRLCNVAKRIIAKIPTKSIKSDDKETDKDCCAICIEHYKVTDVIRVLPCKHEFHKACIDPWLLEHRTCPMCKMDILKHYGFVFTGSQESILQLDLDMEEGDLIDDHSSTDGGNQRRNSVSPLPQIRASAENQMSRGSSLDSDSDREVSSPNETTPSLDKQKHHHQQFHHKSSTEETDICVGCLAAALNKKQKNLENNFSNDDSENDQFPCEPHGSSSLPTTLKKYKGNHSTGSCRGINPPDHYHHHHNHQQTHHTKLPFKLYKTEKQVSKKVRTPLKNLMSQSMSAPCDNSSLNAKHDNDIECGRSSSPSQKSPAHLNKCDSIKINIDYHHDDEDDGDNYPGSDDTETNSDNDLIVKCNTNDSSSSNSKKK